MSIEIDHLSFSYRGSKTKVLDDITLSLPRGSFTGLVGPSGCGKTTLARCLNGLIPHFYPGEMTGNVIINEWNTIDYAAYELAQKVGLVFQNPENQLVAPNVEREIAFGPENLGVPRQEIRRRVEELIRNIRLEEIRDKAPFELSGGEQQRVAIAATLALQPEILVLDEPTSNLDPLSAFELLQLLHRLNREKLLTIILIEHRLELVAPLAQELVVLDEGRVIAKGPTREVLMEEKVAEVGVAIPKVVQLAKKLNRPHLIQACPLSVESAVKAILEELKR
ncbi:MAG: energy-coupling factor ABC transporter ATP-binding protein [Promethearchaeota archaeon]